MNNKFTWVPLYKELAQALLRYRNDRKSLVEWIYSDLGKITRGDGKSLVDYLHKIDHSRIVDIDPFSVYGIFNRSLTWSNRTELLKKFKEHFDLNSDIPTDFDGIPILDARRSFFFSWYENNDKLIKDYWALFEKVVNNEEYEKEYNQVLDDGMAKYSLTMTLFWIDPDQFLSLDSRNRSYLELFGYPLEYSNLRYKDYKLILDRVKNDMASDNLKVKSFIDLSYEAWIKSTETPDIWMWSGDGDTFTQNILKAGSSGKGINYPSFKTKDELGKAYRELAGNSDVKIPYMYWDMIRNMKIGDIVVVYSSHKENKKPFYHKLYGWGRITSDCYFKMDEENPIQRNVEWYYPQPAEPVIENRTKNTLYLHKVEGLDAFNIITLMGITDDKKTRPAKTTDRKFWLAGYAFGSTDSQLDRFTKNGIWAGSSSDSVNRKIEQLKAGDVLVLKATGTKGKNHDIPFLRVKGLALVLSDKPTFKQPDYEVKVQYLEIPEKDFEGSIFGKYRQTIHECDNQEIMDYISQYLDTEDMAAPSQYAEYIKLLEETHNLVLTGAPGTGKTYMARAIAEAMGAETAFVQFHPSYDYTDFVEGLRPVNQGEGQMGFERKDGVFKEFCKKAVKNIEDSLKSRKELEEEKSLEDRYNEVVDMIENGDINEFILKTKKKMEVVKISDFNNIILRTPGSSSSRTYTVSFDRIAKLAKAYPDAKSLNSINNINNALRNAIGGCNASAYWAVLNEVYKQGGTTNSNAIAEIRKRPFVFIIDEINRGEASKIFGELFFAIDPGYRGNKDNLVQTQYQNLVPENDVFAKGFYVPENVYILATMNDIDRSVESMDFAMRRRFTWKEVSPDDTESMLDSLSCAAEAKAAMKRLNKAITETDGLGAAFSIGPSYFLKLRDNGGNFEKLWNMNIQPLLKEYLRGMRKSNDILEKYRKAFFNTKEESTENSELVDED